MNATPEPALVEHRRSPSSIAIVFLHGFSGSAGSTWGSFIPLLLDDNRVRGWDVFSLGYPSSLRVDVVGIWAADPGIAVISKSLSTTLSLPPFAKYKRLVLVAHSMGGLVLQRCLVDDNNLRSRVSDVFLYGTPSAGLQKAGFASKFKRQVRDMAPNSTFIIGLRKDWTSTFVGAMPFRLVVIAGDRDEFVPSVSSLGPFDRAVTAIIPGQHLEIVRPTATNRQSIEILVATLSGTRGHSAFDNAQVAAELGRFREAISIMEPHADELDDSALVSLALALDSVGRPEDAVRVMERRMELSGRASTDALGTLAGRFKRRWLTGRSVNDLSRARELYEKGFRLAEEAQDSEQAFYHSINIAFLDLVSAPDNSRRPETVSEYAKKAREHCARAQDNHWKAATEAEAALILDGLEQGAAGYRVVIQKCKSPREIESMFSQAIQIARKLYKADGEQEIEKAFGFNNPESQ